MKKTLLIFLVLLPVSISSYCQGIPDNTDGRLWGLCKFWGYMKAYHPNTCSVEWDSLLNATIPRVINSGSNADYNNILQEWMQDLEQIPASMASLPPAGGSNLNLDVSWRHLSLFNTATQGFLDTFYSRAGRNDSATCHIAFYYLNDPVSIPLDFTNEANRLTTMFHYWDNFNYFGPYRTLADIPWDSTLLHYIPLAREAQNKKELTSIIMRMHAKTDDSHNGVLGGSTFDDSLNKLRKSMGIVLGRIDHKTVVTRVYPGIADVYPGDIVLEINGQAPDAIAGYYRQFIPVSNDSRFFHDVYPLIVKGTGNTPATLKLEGPGQQVRVTTLPYSMVYFDWYNWAYEDYKPEWTVLCNDYGYINMHKLKTDHVAEVYEALKQKAAIIIDVREYLTSAQLWDLAPYFFRNPVLSGYFYNGNSKAPGWFSFDSDSTNLGSWDNPAPYPGQVYLLVNEAAMSAAEYFVQYMSRIPGARVIGSQTAGADGGLMIQPLTGNNLIRYAYTQVGIVYADGYQCQRNGIRIDQEVSPTVQGIRESRDEVLEYVTGCTTGIGAVKADPVAVQLFPNPVYDRLSFHITTPYEDVATVRITDLAGRLCITTPGKKVASAGSTFDVDVPDLKPGLYFATVLMGKGSIQTLKFVKE